MAYIEPSPTIYISEVREYNSVSRITSSNHNTTIFLEEAPTHEETSSTSVGVSDFNVECFCVTWLRERKGYNVKGNADTIQPNVSEPFVYGVVIFDYDGVRHVAGIKYIMLDRILVEESNYEKCTPTERVIMLDDPNIVGYYYKNPN